MKYHYAHLRAKSDGVYYIVYVPKGFKKLSCLNRKILRIIATNWAEFDYLANPSQPVHMGSPTSWAKEYKFYRTRKQLLEDKFFDLL